MLRTVTEAARALTHEALDVLAAVMRDETASPAARVSAATHVLDRGWGKPKETVDASVKMSLEDLVLASYKRQRTVEHLPTGEAIETVKTAAVVASQPSRSDMVAASYRAILRSLSPMPNPTTLR
jgi:hypothetical protein